MNSPSLASAVHRARAWLCLPAMTIAFRRPRNRAVLSAFDVRGREIFEQILDLTEYREAGHPVVDDDMYRKRHGIRRVLGKLYGASCELLRSFENVYDAAGDLETAHVRHADGTETHVP